MAADQNASDTSARGGINPTIQRLGAYSWRLVAIGVVAWFVLRLLGQLRVVIFPVVVATLITVALSAPAGWLRRRGWRPLLTTWTVFAGFLGVLVIAGFLVVPAVADEFADLGPTVDDAVEDVKTWIVEDSPFDIDRRRLEELEDEASDSLRRSVRSSGGQIVKGAVLVVEIVAGILLSLVLTFFFVKDGERFQRWALRQIPSQRHDLARRLGARAWTTLGGYLRGSALLGVIEGIIIGVALWVTGSALVVPVMVVTFLAAFVPFVGAIAAGVLAVAVALATGGTTPALIVAIVAIGVQQLDNDLLAPYVFGRTLRLHPVVILLSVGAGGTLAGLAGAFLAVPVTAVIVNVIAEARSRDPARSSPSP